VTIGLVKDLLVRVCVPVKVATVESIAIVTAADPLKLVPDKPVPIVNVLVTLPADVAVEALPVRAPTKVVEVTEVKPANVVTVAPRETAVDPIVTELLVSPALFTAPDALTFGVSSDRFLLMVIVDPYYVFIIKAIISSTK
jgi:hypothetical protein